MWIEKTTMQCYKIIGKIIGIHHECECGIIKKICAENHQLASRGLPSDGKR